MHNAGAHSRLVACHVCRSPLGTDENRLLRWRKEWRERFGGHEGEVGDPGVHMCQCEQGVHNIDSGYCFFLLRFNSQCRVPAFCWAPCPIACGVVEPKSTQNSKLKFKPHPLPQTTKCRRAEVCESLMCTSGHRILRLYLKSRSCGVTCVVDSLMII